MKRTFGILVLFLLCVLIPLAIWAINSISARNGAAPVTGKPANAFCDAGGKRYSEGALVRRGNEIVKCSGGRWVAADI
jgi:hypothetical protein